MTIPMGELWQHGETPLRLPKDWPLYDLDTVEVGAQIGPISYEADEATLRRYAEVMGNLRCLYPTVPARGTDILRNSARTKPSNSINARMMMELRTPVAPGDILTLQGLVVSRFERRGKPYVVIQSETTNQDGEVVERLRRTLLNARKEVARKWSFLRTPAS